MLLAVAGALFVTALVGLALVGRVPIVVAGAYLLASVAAFAVYAADKSAARRGAWRTPEGTLHGLALIGGWPGALVAQRVLRHKSSKAAFQVVFWLTVVANCIALTWFLLSIPGGPGE